MWRKSPIWLAPPMPGDRARERHHGDDLAPRPHAGVARRPRRVADHLHLEAEARAGVEHPDRRPRPPRRARSRAGSRLEPIVVTGQVAASGSTLPCGKTQRPRRRVPPVRVAVEDQVVEDERGDVVEHQRGDDLVGAQERPQQARDRAPGGAEHGAAGDHRHDQDRRRLAREQQRHAGGADRAEVELTLGADVEQVHPERDGGGEPGERERRRGDERVRERAVCENAASNSRRSVVIGRWPVARSRIAIATCATTSEPSGTATISQRRCLSRFSIRTRRFTRRPCRRAGSPRPRPSAARAPRRSRCGRRPRRRSRPRTSRRSDRPASAPRRGPR